MMPLHAARMGNRLGRYEKQHPTIGRCLIVLSNSFSALTTATNGVDASTVTGRHVFVVDKVKFKGHGRDHASAVQQDSITLRMTDGSTSYDLPFAVWGAGATGTVFPIDIEWKLNGRLVLPPGWYLQAKISTVTAASKAMSVVATVYGETMSEGKALALGLFGKGFAGVSPQLVGGLCTSSATRTKLFDGVAGQSIQIEAFHLRALGTGTNDFILLEWGNGTTFYPCARIYAKDVLPQFTEVASTDKARIPGPDGYNLYATTGNAGGTAIAGSAAIIARYVRHPDCIDLTGRHNWFGTFTTGGTTTSSDTSHNTHGVPWVTDEWAGYTVRTISGTGSGQTLVVKSNTSTQLTFSTTATATSTDTKYVIDGGVGYSGISDSDGSSTVMNDSTAAFATNALAGKTFRVASGPMAGATSLITSNTATAITLTATLAGTITSGTKYEIVTPLRQGKYWWMYTRLADASTGVSRQVLPTHYSAAVIPQGVMVSGISSGTLDYSGWFTGTTRLAHGAGTVVGQFTELADDCWDAAVASVSPAIFALGFAPHSGMAWGQFGSTRDAIAYQGA